MQFLSLNSDADHQSCLPSPSNKIITIIKKCVAEHNKTSEASECLTNFIEVSTLDFFHET